MGKFLDSEQDRQAQLKHNPLLFSDAARRDGGHSGKLSPFCLPPGRTEENLFHGFRTDAIEWFRAHKITWHDDQDGNPSSALCDAQVCCVNVLFAFADNPEALAALLQPVFPGIRRMLPVEDGKFVTFAWIGERNYLDERVRQGSHRTRGANFTCADALVAFERMDGRKQVVLIAWTYTESYHSIRIKTAWRGSDRAPIYQPLFDKPDSPLDKDLIPSFEALLFEPFYQLMRLQFLAHEMERARELKADIVSLLHIAPSRNEDFRKVTSPQLKGLGETAIRVWERLVRVQEPRRFASHDSERLLAPLLQTPPAGLEDWAGYVKLRYGQSDDAGTDRSSPGADTPPRSVP